MDVKWSYCLIAGIYMLLIVLRVINHLNQAIYRKENADVQYVFSIKKDFFTVVTSICIAVTIGINGAALIGGQALNTSSMIISILVIGLMLLNSFTFILYSETTKTICFLGYILQKGDVECLKIKQGKKKNVLNLTFTKEIESYNYAKVLVFGNQKESLTRLLSEMIEVKETDK